MFVPFEEMPAYAKVWLYPCSENLRQDQRDAISKDIEAFVEEWLSHKRIVKGSGGIVSDRIIFLTADEEVVDVSGCSIDSSVRFIKSLEDRYQIQCFDRTQMIYQSNGQVNSLHFRNIASVVESGDLNEDDLVFNIQANTVAQLQQAWIPFSQSPYARFVVS